MSTPDLASLLEDAVRVAREAGEITLSWFETDLDVERKADATEVTAADRASETYLRSRLGELTPDYGILGEEFGRTAGVLPYSWVLDPIDGTRSFVRSVPLYSVLVALYDETEGEPLLGVIHVPATGLTVCAARGSGCYRNSTGCRVSEVRDPAAALVLTTDAFDTLRREPEIAERLRSAGSPTRTWGDAYGYAMVASGLAEAMIDPVVSMWDVAAIKPIILEAGGVYTDCRGQATGLGTSALAGNPALHAYLLGTSPA